MGPRALCAPRTRARGLLTARGCFRALTVLGPTLRPSCPPRRPGAAPARVPVTSSRAGLAPSWASRGGSVPRGWRKSDPGVPFLLLLRPDLTDVPFSPLWLSQSCHDPRGCPLLSRLPPLTPTRGFVLAPGRGTVMVVECPERPFPLVGFRSKAWMWRRQPLGVVAGQGEPGPQRQAAWFAAIASSPRSGSAFPALG